MKPELAEILVRIHFYERNPRYRGEWYGYVAAVVIAVLLVIFALVLWNVLMRFAGGWRSVEKVFRAKEVPRGSEWRAYGSVSRMVQNTLRFHTTGEGIFVERIQIFDRLNKPLFIPWTELRDVQEGKSYTAERMVKFRVGEPCVGGLLLPLAVIQRSPGNFLLEGLAEQCEVST